MPKQTESGAKGDDMSAQGTETTGDNRPRPEDVAKVLSSAMTDLAQENREAYDILQSHAERGALEQHQTAGELNDIADDLLRTLRREKGTNAD